MGIVSWKSPSNIALVKYWGKKDSQIPMNASISLTLQASYTETKVTFNKGPNDNTVEVSLLFEGEPNILFENRIQNFTNTILKYIPSLKGLQLQIESSNSFPHSSGIASSASAMSAYALCLISIEKELAGTLHFMDDFYKKASFIARLGSGSAARSIYGGINIWGELPDAQFYSNEYATEISKNCHPIFSSYQDSILIVSDKSKKVSSSVGHSLMNKHPFAAEKFRQGNANAKKLLKILKTGNQIDFIHLVEEEALSLHAMMMTSNPSFLLMEPNTLEIITRVRNFRESKSVHICFTLDAGANVHLLYSEKEKQKVQQFIEHELSPFCYNNKWINDCVGKGPEIIR